MNGLDCAKCQKSRKKGTEMELIEMSMRIKTKEES